MPEFTRQIIEIPKEYRPKIEDLPGELSRIAAEIERYRPGMGVEITLFLAQVFHGQPLYIRNINSLVRAIRDDAIRIEYDRGGITMLALASKWRLGHRRVKQILARPGKTDKEQKQMKMW